jgi:hypothetical protein
MRQRRAYFFTRNPDAPVKGGSALRRGDAEVCVLNLLLWRIRALGSTCDRAEASDQGRKDGAGDEASGNVRGVHGSSPGLFDAFCSGLRRPSVALRGRPIGQIRCLIHTDGVPEKNPTFAPDIFPPLWQGTREGDTLAADCCGTPRQG